MATKFKMYLVSHDIKQREISILTGWKEAKVSNMVSGKTRMLAEEVAILADVLECEPSDIHEFKSSIKTEPEREVVSQ